MANTFTAAKPQFWQDAFQTLWKPVSVYGQVAQVLSTEVRNGDRVHRPTTSDVTVGNLTVGSDITIQDVTTSDEYLLVDLYKGAGIGIDQFDQKQTNIDLMRAEAKNMVRNLTNVIDSEFQYLALDAATTLDDSSLGGTAGVPLTVNGTNIYDMVTKAKQYQFETGFDNSDAYCLLDPATFQIFESNGTGRETMYGDQLWKDGFTGRGFQFAGVDFYETSNYTRSMRLDYSGQPSNGETLVFTVGGVAVTVTFVSSIGTTAGNVLIGGDADTTYANLIGLLNDNATTSATQVAFSATNQRAMQGVVATQDTSGNTVTVYSKGKSLAITDGAANVSVNATYTAKSLQFGRKGLSFAMALQIMPDVLITQEPKQLRSNVLAATSFGTKAFTDGSQTAVELYLAA